MLYQPLASNGLPVEVKLELVYKKVSKKNGSFIVILLYNVNFFLKPFFTSKGKAH